MTDQVPSKDQVRIASLEHRLLSEEQEARAADIEHKLRFGWAQKKASRLIVDLRDELDRLNADLAYIRRRTGFWGEVPVAADPNSVNMIGHPELPEELRGDELYQYLQTRCQALWRTNITLTCTRPRGHEGDHRADCGYTFNGEVDVRASQPPGEGYDANGSPV